MICSCCARDVDKVNRYCTGEDLCDICIIKMNIKRASKEIKDENNKEI